jgi:hypothetical protein
VAQRATSVKVRPVDRHAAVSLWCAPMPDDLAAHDALITRSVRTATPAVADSLA